MHPLAALGAQLAAANRLPEAEDALRRALRVLPGHPPTLYNLGVVLRRLGRDAEASEMFGKTLRRDPNHFGALVNQANLLHEAGDNPRAEACCLSALKMQRVPEVLSNLGRIRRVRGNLPGAVAAFEEALSLRPDQPDARYTLGIVRMMTGDWRRGFADYEARLASPQANERRLTPCVLPPGEAPWAGRRVLVRWEQGFGDVIHFCRYLPRLAAAGARVTLECQPQLVRLLAGLAGTAEVTDKADPADFDLTVPVMSLAFLLGDEAPFDPGPYLAASGAPVLDVAALPGLKVGLHWQGNAAYVYDRFRSVSPAAFAPFAACPGVSFVNLQVGPASALADRFPAPMADAGGRIRDFADAAATLAALDLLITADSAVAHLAGAMGKPVWLLVSAMGDWRWGAAGETSPWYAGVRVFRQERLNDWKPAAQRIAAELARLAGG